MIFLKEIIYIPINKDGTFKENLVDQFESISMGSMGADAADLNNDSKTRYYGNRNVT